MEPHELAFLIEAAALTKSPNARCALEAAVSALHLKANHQHAELLDTLESQATRAQRAAELHLAERVTTPGGLAASLGLGRDLPSRRKPARGGSRRRKTSRGAGTARAG
jgi:hypothetical protein